MAISKAAEQAREAARVKGKFGHQNHAEADVELGVGQSAMSLDEKIEAAWNPSTSVGALAALAEDEDRVVRWGVAENPSTPTETLATLAEDKSGAVREAARETIARRA